jgi:two-component system sensor histidine kinase and response regulator WspE
MSQSTGGLGDLSMYDLFRLEVENQVSLLNKNLLELENQPSSPQLLESLMRASHSLKGAARMVGVDAVVKIAHVMEDCFVAAQNGHISITSSNTDHLLGAIDAIEMIAKLNEYDHESWMAENQELVLSHIKELEDILDGKISNKVSQENKNYFSTQEEVKEKETGKEKVENQQIDSDDQNVKSEKITDDKSLRINADRLSRILGLTSEILVESRTISHFSENLALMKRRQSEIINILERLRDVGEKDYINSASEYYKQLLQKMDQCRQLLSTHQISLDEYDRKNVNLSNKLYNEVVGSRMRPFSECALGFKRMVRDLARVLSKEINLKINGMDTPVDRDVLEKIKAPLNHILRNAVDHGIESVTERANKNKQQTATINLSAKHGNGMLRIVVEDDGAGIDLDRLQKKLVDKKLVDEHMLPDLEQSELLEFLFLPDFSTKEHVTEISGRGVGLDVVRDMVRELGGTVTIDTKKDEGTRFTLQLPLTLSILSALLVEIADEPYAFPLVRVDRILRISSDNIQSLEGRQYIKYGVDNIGLISGAQILGFESNEKNRSELTVIVISDHLDRYGVVVDSFIGQRQLSVQALDPRLGKIADINSTALMEDGTPLFILDVDDMVRSINHIVSGGRLGTVFDSAKERIKSHRKQILVVDDSLTIRGVERDLLESNGYQVEVAVDGMDGWNAVRASQYDLVITDIDMPRMDGIELVKAIKQDLHLKNVPVMIVSYKDRSEDRRRGLDAGADYYLTKGNFQDETLIEAVIDLIGEASRR